MAERKEVSCIVKREHHNPHERIQAIGGIHNGSRWKRSEDDAIRDIKNGTYEYFVSQGGRTAKVIVAKHNEREYLKTENDGYSPDNLLSLSSCPV